MRVAYLGLFSKVFNWVFDKILAPVVKFIGELLSSVFEWIFNTILMPILTAVFKTILPWILDLFKQLFAGIFYQILAALCKVLDYLEEIFNIFSGAREVTYKISDTQSFKGQFLECLFYTPSVQKMYWTIFLAAFFLAGVFTIIAVMKSTIDLDFENKRPVGAVLRAAFKAMATFFLLQVICLFIIKVSGVVINTIETGGAIAMSQDATKTSLGRTVFCLATMDAANDPKINISTLSEENKSKDVFSLGARKDFYSGASDYSKKDLVESSFELVKFDFFTTIVVVIFLAVILAICAITFVQRVFEVLILFLVSPFFVATMPLDDGEKYKKWKDLFIGKVFGGYGGALAMKIYLMLVPVIMGSGIVYGDGTDATGTLLIKIIFLCGGAYALYKAGPMITTLINWQAGQSESQTTAAVGKVAGKGIQKGAVLAARGATSLASAPFKMAGRALGNLAGVKGKKSTETQDAKWEKMQKAGLSEEDRKKLEDKEKKNGEGGEDKEKDDGKILDNEGKGGVAGGEAGGGATKDNRWGISKKFDSFARFCHKVLPHKANKDGSYSFGLLGFRVNYDKNGNRVGFKVPCASFSFDKNGKYQCEKVKIPGILTAQRGEKSGMSITNVPAIGLRREEGKDGRMHKTDLLGVYHRTADPQGKYHKSEIMGIKFGQAYNTETGQYESSGVRIGNFIFGGADPADADKTKVQAGSRRKFESNDF